MDSEQLADCAAIHAASFAVGWAENELEFLVANRNVRADCAISSSGGRVQGFVMSRIVLDEAEILTIAVKSTYRRKGVGKKLLDYHIEKLKNSRVKEIYLEVSEDNKAAINLYLRFGFGQVGVRKSYYAGVGSQRISALTMKLVLT